MRLVSGRRRCVLTIRSTVAPTNCRFTAQEGIPGADLRGAVDTAVGPDRQAVQGGCESSLLLTLGQMGREECSGRHKAPLSQHTSRDALSRNERGRRPTKELPSPRTSPARSQGEEEGQVEGERRRELGRGRLRAPASQLRQVQRVDPQRDAHQGCRGPLERSSRGDPARSFDRQSRGADRGEGDTHRKGSRRHLYRAAHPDEQAQTPHGGYGGFELEEHSRNSATVPRRHELRRSGNRPEPSAVSLPLEPPKSKLLGGDRVHLHFPQGELVDRACAGTHRRQGGAYSGSHCTSTECQ